MKINKLYLILACVPFIIFGTIADPFSLGAPVSSSGAPGELTCAQSGCHDDNQINTGTAQSSITFSDINGQYVPGQIYQVKVRIDDIGINRFGFQLVAIKNADQKQAGAFIVTDSLRTHIMKNTIAFQDREYVTYTYLGSSALASGYNEWTINWQAPASDVGPVTFYVATLSGNDDATDKNDFSYTINKSITAKTSGINDNYFSQQVFIYPSVISDGILNIDLKGNQSLRNIKLIDVQGKQVYSETYTSSRIYLPNEIAAGVYTCIVSGDNGAYSQKIIITNN